MEHKTHHLSALFGITGGIIKFFTAVTLPSNFWSAFVGSVITGIAVTIVSYITTIGLKWISRRIIKSKHNKK